MSALSRNKGSSFERLVSKMIAKAIGVGVKECYRTPLSGGHPYADRGDLTMSPVALAKFPYTCECKHNKEFKAEHLLNPTVMMASWAVQVLTAAREAKRKPLLVVRGNRTAIYALWPITGHMETPTALPFACLRLGSTFWRAARFETWLRLQVVDSKKKKD